MEEIRTIQTTVGNLEYYRDWDNDGAIVMKNPKTIKMYRKLKYDTHPSCDECGVFFAFSNEQFTKGYNHLVELGHIKDGDKVLDMGGGGFGTKQGVEKFLKFYEDVRELIKKDCDAQEAYFFEYNNYESMINWDGDKDAYGVIVDIWGEEIAKQLQRY